MKLKMIKLIIIRLLELTIQKLSINKAAIHPEMEVDLRLVQVSTIIYIKITHHYNFMQLNNKMIVVIK